MLQSCSKVLLVHYGKKNQWKYYGICHIHLKLFLFTMYKSMQSNSNIRCLLLEKIAENIYQVLQSHFKKARY